MTTPVARRRRPPALVVLPILAIVLAIGGAVALSNSRPAPTDPLTSGPAAFPPPSSPIVVNLNRAGGGPAHLGYPVGVTASALGMAGIAGLELWAGGERIELTSNVDPLRPAQTARWEWTPTEAGATILVARAFDALGRGGQSAPVRITVVPEAPLSFSLQEVTAGDGETLEAIVERVGGDLSQAAYWNRDLPAGPLAPGTIVVVPTPDPGMPPPVATTGAGDRAARTRTASLDDAVLAAGLAPIVPAGLAIPDLDVSVDDCTVTATASGGGSGSLAFAFSALPPVSDSFVALPPVAPAADGSATTSFGALGGMNFLTVASYDTAATAPSAIVPLAVPPECGAGGWSGNASLEAGKLVFDGTADRAYLYLRVGDASWQRLPAAAGSFVEPVNGVFDFGSLLPATAGEDLRLEAWGWVGGSLTSLGSGSYDAPGQILYSGGLTFNGDPVLGFGTSLDIVLHTAGGEFEEELTRDSAVDLPGPNSQSSTRKFKWSTTVPGVTHLAWQILPYPLDDTTAITPPFLIDTGTIEVKGLSTGYFSIDLKPYLTGEAPGVTSASEWVQKQLINQVVATSPYLGGATPAPADVMIDPGGIFLPGSSAPPATGGGSATAGGPATVSEALVDNLALLAPAPSALYVRVIPFIGTASVGKASNSVSFDIVEPGEPFYIDTSPPPPPPSYDDAHTMSAVFFAPTGSNFDYYACVIVVKGGYTGLYGNWSNGTTHCRPKDDDGWSLSDAFDSFVGWVGDVWDYIAEGYQWVQDAVVDAVLAFVPCEQIANQVADDGKEVCRKIAKTALQAALASFGIPPEIPNWEATISAAKGDLRTFILENAKQFPGVSEACTAADATHAAKSSFPTCDALVDKAIDKSIGDLVKQRSEAAAQSAGVFVPAGITVEPHPKGMAQPPHFEVTVTRTNAPLPIGTQCSINARMTSQVVGWSWLEYSWTNGKATVVKKSGNVNGTPFLDVKQAIAPLAPGQSASYELWLTKRVVWFEPDGWNDHYAEEYALWNGSWNHAWVLLQKGATVTGSLSGNCTPDGQSIQVLTGHAWE